MEKLNAPFSDLFSIFLSHHQNEQWYTAHSHHFWPDCTEQAVVKYWNDSAKYVDNKWEIIFGEKIPLLKSHIAKVLNISNENQFVFAPNTHELIYRLLTTFKPDKKIKVLTTNCEFHSFSRQIKLFEEHGLAEVNYLNVEPYDDFIKAVEVILNKPHDFDLIFLSHVFYNSGLVVDNSILDKIYNKTKNTKTLVVLDAYHSFMALPFSMKTYEDHFCYLAGSYKYAGAGEGLCFMYIPPKLHLKPIYSGWFADFSGLSHQSNNINYDPGASSLAGSTMDYSTLYKLLSILELYEARGITVNMIHEAVVKRQHEFLSDLEKFQIEHASKDHPFKLLQPKNIIMKAAPDKVQHGHFFAFDIDTEKECQQLYNHLKKQNIFTDFRSNRLRFGFGLFQNWRLNINIAQ